jgi:hypothetical protein
LKSGNQPITNFQAQTTHVLDAEAAMNMLIVMEAVADGDETIN